MPLVDLTTVTEGAGIVYAPFIGVGFLPIGEDMEIVWTGVIEENSEIKFNPIFRQKGGESRLLASQVIIKSYDAEATADKMNKFFKWNNRRVEFFGLCDSAIYTDKVYTYHFYQEHLPKRGMRWVHEFRGLTYKPTWVTFVDKDWTAIKTSIFGRVLGDGGGGTGVIN